MYGKIKRGSLVRVPLRDMFMCQYLSTSAGPLEGLIVIMWD